MPTVKPRGEDKLLELFLSVYEDRRWAGDLSHVEYPERVKDGAVEVIVGLPSVKEPHLRHIRGPLWVIRLTGKAGMASALYVTAREQRVVILRAFLKKTEKTSTSEIDLALQRAKELKS